MSFVSKDRAVENNLEQINQIRVNPDDVEVSKSFLEVIPKEFRPVDLIGKFKFWEKSSVDRWLWDKIPEDARDLDVKFDCRNPEKIITPEAREAAEKLKDDSKAYLNKNGTSNSNLEILQKTFVAKKMLNKLVSCGWQLIPLYKDGDEVKEIKEGAKNVVLLPDTKLKNIAHYRNDESKMNNYINGTSAQMKFMNFKPFVKIFDESKNEPKAEDCRQAYLGDCWLQSVLIDILTKKGKEPIKEMFKDDGTNVKVRLYKPEKVNGKRNFLMGNYIPKIYTVPKQIPVTREKNALRYNLGRALWVHYLQAAVAKSGIIDKPTERDFTVRSSDKKFRDYSSVELGTSVVGYKMILGSKSRIYLKLESQFTDEKARLIFTMAEFAKSQSRFCSISFKPFPKSDGVGQSAGEEMNRGLVSNHGYALIDFKEERVKLADGKEDTIKYIKLINPWYNRKGRYYGEDGNSKGQEKSFEGIGDEGFWLKLSTVVKHLQDITFDFGA